MTELDWQVIHVLLTLATTNPETAVDASGYFTRVEIRTARKALKRLQQATGF